MTLPVMSDIVDFQKKLIVDEMSYDRDEMTKNHFSLMKMLTTEQKGIYQEIMSSVMSESGRFFFLYEYGVLAKHFYGRLYLQACDQRG